MQMQVVPEPFLLTQSLNGDKDSDQNSDLAPLSLSACALKGGFCTYVISTMQSLYNTTHYNMDLDRTPWNFTWEL